MPSQPWLYIALDFVTGLPPSKGNTIILTVVEIFSKSVQFIALTKLPSAKKTAHLMVTHVFRLHGIPSNIIPDRGTEFISPVWNEFCQALCATVSIS